MKEYQIEYTSDGCPNDCGYCRDLGLLCVYTEEGKIRNYKCSRCGKKIASDELYQYKDFDYCENCIDKAIEMYGRN